ncbi:MAG: hypothetical protein PHX11_05220, partial [Bacteroidales bacterium]|nr:hypothetical protein [Bacteroidales bacterium]
TASLKQFGTYLLRALSDYFQWDVPGRYIINGTVKGNRTVYKKTALPRGTYRVFTWDNAWIPRETIIRKRDGAFRYVIRSEDQSILLLE